MSTQIQRRRGTTAEHSTFTGVEGELTVDTTKDTVVVHDGATTGGRPLLREDGTNSALALGSAATPSLKFTGDTNTGIYSPGADQVAISTNGSAKLFINSSGVITTDSGFTSSRFNVVNTNTVSTYDRMLFLRSNNLSNGFIGLGSDSFYIASASNAPLVFCTNSDGGVSGSSVPTNERLRITSDGKLGVGTSAPRSLLSLGAGTATSTATPATLDLGGTYSSTAGANPKLRIFYDGTSSAGFGASANQLDYTAIAGDSHVFYVGTTQVMKLDGSGRLGIGTTSVSATGERLSVRNDSGPGIIVRSTGNPSMRFYNSVDAADNSCQINYYSGDSFSFEAIPELPIKFLTDNTERLRITSDGKLGLGTTSPSCQFNTQTSSTGELARFASSAASGEIYLNLGYTSTNQVTIGYDIATGDGILRTNTSGSQLIFKTGSGGNEAARIDGSQRLLVGTSSARSNFYNTTVDAGLQLEGTGAQRRLSIVGSDFGSALILGLQKSGSPGGNTIVASGDGVGEISFQGNDGTEFVPCAQIKAEIDGTPGSNDMPGRLVFSTTADGASSPTERMRISQNGQVLIGTLTTANVVPFSVESAVAGSSGGNYPLATINSTGTGDAGAACLHLGKKDNVSATSNPFIRFYINNAGTGSGQINANGASSAAFGTFSDERLKENISNLPSQLQNICSLRPVEFDYKDGSGHQVGFIAQEMQTIYPDVVGETDGMLTVTGWSKTEARLVKALQEAVERIETLEAEVAALKAS